MPVNLDHSDGLTGVSVVIAYDTSRLDVSAADVQKGSLTEGFDSFAVRVDQDAGIIYISGYRTDGPLSGQGAGSVAVISFHVKNNAPPGEAFINLLENAGNCRTALSGADAQGNSFLFDLEPRPSNATGDALDGRVTILPAVVDSTRGPASSLLGLLPVLGTEAKDGRAGCSTFSQATAVSVGPSNCKIQTSQVLQTADVSEFVKKWGLAPADPYKTLTILTTSRCLSPFFHKLSGGIVHAPVNPDAGVLLLRGMPWRPFGSEILAGPLTSCASTAAAEALPTVPPASWRTQADFPNQDESGLTLDDMPDGSRSDKEFEAFAEVHSLREFVLEAGTEWGWAP